MQRRTFLSLCSGVATLGVAARVGAVPTSPFCHVSGEILHPGAPLHIDAAGTPAGARVHLRVVHAGRSHEGGHFALVAGQRLTVATPYPHDDLVRGDYTVEVELRSRTGRLLERRVAGTYRVQPVRFSA